MAIALVSGQSAKFVSAGTTSFTATLPSAPTAGNFLVAVFTAHRVGSPTMPSGWLTAAENQNSTNVETVGIYYLPNVPGGTGAGVTFTIGTSAEGALYIAEFSGVATSSPLDQTGTKQQNTNSGSIAIVTAGNLAVDGELGITGVVMFTTSSVTFTQGSGWAQMIAQGTTGEEGDNAYQILTTGSGATLSDTVTMSLSNHHSDGVIATFKPASGTLFTQTLSVATSTAPSLTKNVGKNLSVATATAPSLLTAKLKLVLLSVVTAIAPSLTKQIGKGLSVATATAPSVKKTIGKTLAVVTATAPSIVAAKLKLVLLSVVTAMAPSLTKQAGKNLSVVTATAPTLTKRISKSLSVATATAPSLLTTKVKIVVLSVATATAATLNRRTGKGLSVTTATAPTLTKTISKRLSVATATAPTLTKRIGKALSIATATAPSVLTSRVRIVVLAVVTATAPTLTKTIGKTLSVATVAAPSLTKRIGKGLSVTTSAVVSVLATFGITKARAKVAIADLAAFIAAITDNPAYSVAISDAAAPTSVTTSDLAAYVVAVGDSAAYSVAVADQTP